MPGNKRVYSSRKQEKRKVASEQIDRLIGLALNSSREGNKDLAERQAEIAWNISTRFNVRLGEKRMLYCHSCKRFIVPPENSRIRLSRRRKSVNITCLKCGSTYRRVF